MTRYLKGGRRPVGVRIDPRMIVAVDKLGKRERRNRSELIEEAVALLLHKYGVKVERGEGDEEE